MSMELMVKAMKTRVGNPLRKLVLLKLADNASDQGECWPSYNYIADQCEISRRSVMGHLNALIKEGVISKTIRKGVKGNSSNVYMLNFHLLIPVKNEKDVIVAYLLPSAGDSLGGGAGDSPPSAGNSQEGGAADSPPSAGDSLGVVQEIHPEPITLEPITEPNTCIDSDVVESQASEGDVFQLEPEQSSKPTKPKRTRKAKLPVPDTFDVTQQMIDWLGVNQITTNFTIETSKFLDHHRSKGSTMACWVSAWRNWMRNSMVFSAKPNNPSPQGSGLANRKQDVNDCLTNIQDTNW